MAENFGILFQWLIFLGVAFVSIVASLLVITRKNPIHSALFMVLTLLCVAVLYVLLYSPFIAIVQVVVYAGAIVMLIVFVIMLLDLRDGAPFQAEDRLFKGRRRICGRPLPLRDPLHRRGQIPDRPDRLLYRRKDGYQCEGRG